MKTTLKVYGVWEYVINRLPEPKDVAVERSLANAQSKQWKKDKKKNVQELHLIQQGKDLTVFQKIMTTSSRKIVWETLETSYKGMDKFNIVKLKNTRKDFESLQMKEMKDINSFMNLVLTIVNQLRICGANIEDQTVVEKVLRSLSTKLDVVVATTEEAKDLTMLTIGELMGSLLFHEVMIDKNKHCTLEIAFKSQVSIS